MLDNLNEKQRQSVTSDSKYIRIIAGAGSGKTRVLTSRIVYLIKEKDVFSNKILAITFTNKAAQEMKERVAGDLGIRPTYISTFHSFCVRVLREDIDLLGYQRNFTILDEDDQKQIVKDILKQRSSKFEPKEIVGYISYNKNSNVSPSMAFDLANKIKEFESKSLIYEEYEKRLNDTNCLDFDDLILKTVYLLKHYKNVLEKWRNRFSHILVDEFQDTNDTQYQLVKYLTGTKNSLFVVGDPDQTIYTWRGANVNLILNFEKDFPNALTIVLDKNYRSTQNILTASNQLISHNFKRVEKNMDAFKEKGEEITVKHFRGAEEEANWVANKILTLKSEGENFKDFAILYRANYLSRQMEISLINSAIPYRIYGGLRFFERKEIKDALAYIRLLVNESDDLAFMRIINSPKRGIGDTTLQNIKDYCYENNLPLYKYLKENRDLIRTNREKVNNALDVLYKTMEEAKNNTDEFAIKLKIILEGVDYYSLLEHEENKEERIQNLDELMNGLLYYQNNNPDSTLDEYIQQISLYSSQDDMQSGDFVSLMTVHTAKGLEFENVFIYGFNEGTFPSTRSIEESKEGLEEERRIAYVAITRAKKRLFATSNNGYNFVNRMESFPSRFIEEMGIVKTYDLKQKAKVEKKKEPKKFIPVQNNIKWNLTDKIYHEKFGEGVIINIEDGIILTIVFKDPNVGQKIIMGNFIGLKKL